MSDMQLSLQVVQDLAPDQSSLNAAKKLMQPKKWPVRQKAAQLNSIWGQCQGSGSKPYSAMADVENHGYKCTCPSRKFPCKHVLALLWQFAETPDDFVESETPEWVSEWMQRRKRKTSAAPIKPTSGKSLSQAESNTDTPAELSVEDREKALERQQKLKAKTDAMVVTGLTDFQQWLDDQLHTGVVHLLQDLRKRCRFISARLVDAKAAQFAARVDELPSLVLSRPKEHQVNALLTELGRLILLAQTWIKQPDNLDARRAIITAETKESLLHTDNKHVETGVWQVMGEKSHTRKDGLISQTTWLMKVPTDDQTPHGSQPRFAMLLDYFPAVAGKRNAAFTLGSKLEATLVFYPGQSLTRAFIHEYTYWEKAAKVVLAESLPCIYTAYQQALITTPWLEELPFILSPGRIREDHQGQYWWQDASHEDKIIPLANKNLSKALLFDDVLEEVFIVWQGHQAELISALSATWGRIKC
ncbi:MAG TPA: SWIM zinc finger family protein [Gammaproteobacteria bacterium]|nr:hypothetical protein [Gammaproteobacteria bacterium]HBF09338.1 SWIM zinc finger family protein [Gammaproteobacteria bacterium]HCK92660.1 SWIM zinc finger family protein [Gammaproteobacteria bacterium]|tara:strand:- start:3273 stop:4691 length:1419 start_codon:yes stop_codon:yes gene_type:complete